MNKNSHANGYKSGCSPLQCDTRRLGGGSPACVQHAVLRDGTGAVHHAWPSCETPANGASQPTGLSLLLEGRLTAIGQPTVASRVWPERREPGPRHSDRGPVTGRVAFVGCCIGFIAACNTAILKRVLSGEREPTGREELAPQPTVPAAWKRTLGHCKNRSCHFARFSRKQATLSRLSANSTSILTS